MQDSDPTFRAASKVRVVPSLTGIRGIAAVWVLIYHLQVLSGGSGYKLGLPGQRIWYAGWTGVDLFFLLSGFMLMHSNGRWFELLSLRALYNFAVTRVFRVYPLATVALLLVTLLISAAPSFAEDFSARSPGNLSVDAFIRTAALATRWFPGSGEWNEPVWSLSAEIVGYAFFPLIAFALIQSRSSRVVGLSAGAALLVTMASQFAMGKFGQNDLSLTGALIRMAGYFTAGIASRRFLDLTTSRLINRWASAGAIVAVLGIAGLPFLGAAVGITPVLFCALICALYYDQGIVNRALASPPALFLGKISFPLYLIHAMPIAAVAFYAEQNGASVNVYRAELLVLFGVLILAAWVLHLSVENSAIKIGRKFLISKER